LVLGHAGLDLAEVDIHEHVAMPIDLGAAAGKRGAKERCRKAGTNRPFRPYADRIVLMHRDLTLDEPRANASGKTVPAN
jgi:hypothetical protein